MTNRCRFIEGVLSRSGRLFHNPRRRLRKHYTALAAPANRWSVMPATDAEGPAVALLKRRKTAGPSIKPSD
ncbi:MAG: hypothetical protein ACQEXN_07495 [Actinomycetota bacterium]